MHYAWPSTWYELYICDRSNVLLSTVCSAEETGKRGPGCKLNWYRGIHTICRLPTVHLQLQYALQPSVATYDPTIISINYPINRQGRLGACLHVYPVTCGLCRNRYAYMWTLTHRLSLAYTQAISCASCMEWNTTSEKFDTRQAAERTR